MSRKFTFLLGAATGAAAMYLMDPRDGQQRRADVQQRAEEVLETPTAQRLTGRAIDLTRPLHDRGPDSDPTLVNKVRSEVLGRDEFQGLSINIAAVDGVVTLRGAVETTETREHLVEAVGRVGGVIEVEDLLHEPGNTPVNMS